MVSRGTRWIYHQIRRRFLPRKPEIELRIAPLLCDKKSIFVDIGADLGNYSVEMASHAASCVAFEPRLRFAAKLQELANTKGLKIQVQPVALSDHSGAAHLRVIAEEPGRSTIESSNRLDDSDGGHLSEHLVPKLRLDDYGLKSVGLVKIDVEGHELAVLQGAEATLRQSGPTILVELEERHCPGTIKNVSGFLATIGYEGFFVLDGALTPIAQFVPSVQQNPANIGGWKENWARRGIYINNFMFAQPAQIGRVKAAIDKFAAEEKASAARGGK
jgi:FkbM family methyltransferase